MPRKKIAEACGLSMEALSNRKKKALKLLKEWLG